MKRMACFLIVPMLVFLVSCTTDSDDGDDGWDAAKVCPETGTNSYGMPNRGTFTDERDGQVYKYTTIGKQVWMAQNLNYDVENDRCYYEEDSCRTMGRVYYPTARPCPAGWHVPTEEEWHKLFDLFEDSNHASVSLRSNYSWAVLNPEDNPNGTDDCGFSVLPARKEGDVFSIDGGKKMQGFESYFLTSTFISDCYVKTLTFASYGRGVMWDESPCVYAYLYIRCVKG